MPWRDWSPFHRSSPSAEDEQPTSALPSASTISKTVTTASTAAAWSYYLSPSTVVSSVVLTAASLTAIRFYKSHLRRIPSADHIKPSFFRKRSLFGYVTSVGDGDGLRLYHTPGGRLAGWGWFPGRRKHLLGATASGHSAHGSSSSSGSSGGGGGGHKTSGSSTGAGVSAKEIRDSTISVRLAGVDAPELAHFGNPAQPFGPEALQFLRSMVLGRYVRAYVWKRDQYERIVATVHVRTFAGLWRNTDVGLAMLRAGLATVYEAKMGQEFGNKEAVYREAEKRAKERGVGMWQSGAWKAGGGTPATGFWQRLFGGKQEEAFETPRQYKARIKADEAQGKKK